MLDRTTFLELWLQFWLTSVELRIVNHSNMNSGQHGSSSHNLYLLASYFLLCFMMWHWAFSWMLSFFFPTSWSVPSFSSYLPDVVLLPHSGSLSMSSSFTFHTKFFWVSLFHWFWSSVIIFGTVVFLLFLLAMIVLVLLECFYFWPCIFLSYLPSFLNISFQIS